MPYSWTFCWSNWRVSLPLLAPGHNLFPIGRVSPARSTLRTQRVWLVPARCPTATRLVRQLSPFRASDQRRLSTMSELDPSTSKNALKKRNVALWFGYIGTCFRGSQVVQPRRNETEASTHTGDLNGDTMVSVSDGTVEGELVQALYRIGAITERNLEHVRKVSWSRASRTDKGVHAVANVVSVKLLLDLERDLDDHEALQASFIEKLNAQLPPSIQVYGGERTTKGFRARAACTMREYEYILPRWVLGGHEDLFVKALRCFEGTHRFHNFSGKERKTRGRSSGKATDASAMNDLVDDGDADDVDNTDDDDWDDVRLDDSGPNANDDCSSTLQQARSSERLSGPGAEDSLRMLSHRDEAASTESKSQRLDADAATPFCDHGAEMDPSWNAADADSIQKGSNERTEQATPHLQSRFQEERELAKQAIRETHPERELAPVEHDDPRCVRIQERKPYRCLTQLAFPVAHPDRLQSPYYIRTVYRFEMEPLPYGPTGKNDFLLVHIRGQSFVLHQIRLLIGAAVLVARGHLSLDALRAALDGPYRVLFWRAPGSCLMLSRPSFWDPRRRRHRLVASECSEQRMSRFRLETLIPHVCALSQHEWAEFLNPEYGARVTYLNQEQLTQQYRLWRERATEAAVERRRQATLLNPRTTYKTDVMVELPRGIQTTLAIQFDLLPGPELARLRDQLQEAAEVGKLPRRPTTEQCLEYCERHLLDQVVS
ncbi:hypothetical protein F1559_003778 [Cyanidiococcus yangmingshanensis]|uniref:Pseudouridine synthase I TruA alpha/beta domain-containing protein n=1 Tax=Cyanidiococcus yangmingshanensis TaxID=2690220 RepID=A0A7J7IEQ1_9RHOD|nr:hypothetical protein F1559_003778 [Cyanidiococcus yangmingshanensis]